MITETDRMRLAIDGGGGDGTRMVVGLDVARADKDCAVGVLLSPSGKIIDIVGSDALPHFGMSQREMSEMFEDMARRGWKTQRGFNPFRRMSDLACRLLAIHIRKATP
jgi:hypothetical protein